MSTHVNVVCRGTKRRGSHSSRTIARYEWSAPDDVWVRVDQHGSASDWSIKGTTASTLVAYPAPRLRCSCGRDEQPPHEDLQHRLGLAQADGELVL